mmetsp:Transcript_9240/g.21769  ORF Transcript_9240/g.21769 Transcript_9240/m.21769 type:complete len:351 (-) Transcript_9240:202-1254(-)
MAASARPHRWAAAATVIGVWLNSSIFLADALFVTPPSKVVPYPSLRLSTADGLGVSYTGFALDAGHAASLPGFALSLNADFGTLSESQFDQLQARYCAWSDTKSKVRWVQDQEYTLLDFLPPIMQVVSGQYFQSTRSRQKNFPSFVDDRQRRYTEQEVLLTSNCWGFAWEVLYQSDNPDTSAMTVSTGDPTSAWRAFTGPGFDLIQSSLTKPHLLTDKRLRNQRLQGGDVLLLWHTIASFDRPNKVYLDHVVTCIDEDVYFEKSGSGDNVPYRIAQWEMILATFHLRCSIGSGGGLCGAIATRRRHGSPTCDSSRPLRHLASMLGWRTSTREIANDSTYSRSFGRRWRGD